MKKKIAEKVSKGDYTPVIVTDLEYSTIDRATAHRWMRLAGAKFCTMQKNYYTDSHENEENKHDREKRYIPMQMRLQLRCPCWYEISLDKCTPEAINHVRASCNLTEDDELPIRITSKASTFTNLSTGEIEIHNTIEKFIKIHVDFLSEDLFISYRNQMMVETGRPGEYFFPIKTVKVPIDASMCGHCASTNSSSSIHRMGHDEACEMPYRNQIVFEVPDEYKYLLECQHYHAEDVCKCIMPILHMGQDEACYSAYALPKREWVIDGKTKLRKKTEV